MVVKRKDLGAEIEQVASNVLKNEETKQEVVIAWLPRLRSGGGPTSAKFIQGALLKAVCRTNSNQWSLYRPSVWGSGPDAPCRQMCPYASNGRIYWQVR